MIDDNYSNFYNIRDEGEAGWAFRPATTTTWLRFRAREDILGDLALVLWTWPFPSRPIFVGITGRIDLRLRMLKDREQTKGSSDK